MEWTRILAYITGSVNHELLLRNEYLATENRILRAKLNRRLQFSDAERATLGEMGFRLGRRAVSEGKKPGGHGPLRTLAGRGTDGVQMGSVICFSLAQSSPRICLRVNFFAIRHMQRGKLKLFGRFAVGPTSPSSIPTGWSRGYSYDRQ